MEKLGELLKKYRELIVYVFVGGLTTLVNWLTYGLLTGSFETLNLSIANAIAWAVCAISPQEIDQINILKASIKGMHGALDMLKVRPTSILVDGNRFYKYNDIPHTCMVKGDARFASIAAASVLAKTYRDEYMLKIAAEHPQYGWDRNMGYPTKEHRAAIATHGATPHHRMSFKLLEDPTLF